MSPTSIRNLPFPGAVLNNLQTWMTRDRESGVSSVCCYQPPFVLLYNEDTTVPDKVGGMRLEKSSKNMAVLCNRNSAFHLQEKVSGEAGLTNAIIPPLSVLRRPDASRRLLPSCSCLQFF